MIKEINWHPTIKQAEALDILEDKETTELLFGGGAGGAKSTLLCAWLIKSSLKYPGTRWLMGRAILKTLKESTLLTFMQLCSKWGLKAGEDFNYRPIDGVIEWFNGSAIYLKDLRFYPQDPEFDELGSTEYTGAGIDECSQVSAKAKDIVMSRIRYKLEDNHLMPKLLLVSNPNKNFLYYDYYKPWKEGTLTKYRKFVQALATDNPYISPHYIESLKKLDKNSMERLLNGNWEYDDDPSRLIEYDAISDMFTRAGERTTDKFLSVDVARFGMDRTTIFTWEGLFIKRIQEFKGYSTEQVEREIEKERAAENIARSHTVIDEDGVGGGVVDHLPGVKGFVNNSRAIETNGKKANYANLKSQCYFTLADIINAGRIGITQGISAKMKQELQEELEQVKRKDADKDGPLAIIEKQEVKRVLGRSPDLSDGMAMRMIFEIRKPNSTTMVGMGTTQHGGIDLSMGIPL